MLTRPMMRALLVLLLCQAVLAWNAEAPEDKDSNTKASQKNLNFTDDDDSYSDSGNDSGSNSSDDDYHSDDIDDSGSNSNDDNSYNNNNNDSNNDSSSESNDDDAYDNNDDDINNDHSSNNDSSTPSPILVDDYSKLGINTCKVRGETIEASTSKVFFLGQGRCEGYYCHGMSGTASYEFVLSATCAHGCVDSSSTTYCRCLQFCPGSSPCSAWPCLNGGTCRETGRGRGYTCTCTSEYYGYRCHRTLDRCKMLNCTNGGTCVVDYRQPSQRRCECPAGFVGERCQTAVCDQSPCQNGGQCVPDTSDTARGYRCDCTGGFSGSDCKDCVDLSPSCEDQAVSGQCQAHAAVMMAFCARSCFFCAEPVCREGWSRFGHHCYRGFDMALDYKAARTRCSYDHSHISSIRSQEENTFIRSLIAGYLWVGLTRAVIEEEQWVWEDGTVALRDGDFVHWHTGFPRMEKESTDDSLCVDMGVNSRWRDLSCKSRRVFVCKYDLYGAGSGGR